MNLEPLTGSYSIDGKTFADREFTCCVLELALARSFCKFQMLRITESVVRATEEKDNLLRRMLLL